MGEENMKHAADKLSRAASAVYLFRTAEPDPMGDPSGDLGDIIANWERDCLVRAVKAAGYESPGRYNQDLYLRTTPRWASLLEIEHVCQCGAAQSLKHFFTKQYGGGTNTVLTCPDCGDVDVYV
jgi:hypothetical protein